MNTPKNLTYPEIFSEEELMKMSLRQIQQIAESYRLWATSHQLARKARTIAAELGDKLPDRYGPKYKFEDGDLGIYFDGYGNVLRVYWQGKVVLSSRQCAPGPWAERIWELYPEAERLADERESAALYEEKKRQVIGMVC